MLMFVELNGHQGHSNHDKMNLPSDCRPLITQSFRTTGTQYHEEQDENEADGCESIIVVERLMPDKLFIPNPCE